MTKSTKKCSLFKYTIYEKYSGRIIK